MIGVIALAGCTRTQYRISADKEVAGLVAEKSSDPRWAYPGWTIDMDPRSRFFDPTDPDHPPMPEDDPAAHQFMHYIDGKRGGIVGMRTAIATNSRIPSGSSCCRPMCR